MLLRQPDGSFLAMDLNLSPILSPIATGEQLWVAMLHDITHHKQSANALQRAALADPLTGIANRRHFDACLEREWQRAMRNAKPLSLRVIDVDHVKLVNDMLGHAAGDQCLQAQSGQSTDCCYCRVGGETAHPTNSPRMTCTS